MRPSFSPRIHGQPRDAAEKADGGSTTAARCERLQIQNQRRSLSLFGAPLCEPGYAAARVPLLPGFAGARAGRCQTRGEAYVWSDTIAADESGAETRSPLSERRNPCAP